MKHNILKSSIATQQMMVAARILWRMAYGLWILQCSRPLEYCQVTGQASLQPQPPLLSIIGEHFSSDMGKFLNAYCSLLDCSPTGCDLEKIMLFRQSEGGRMWPSELQQPWRRRNIQEKPLLLRFSPWCSSPGLSCCLSLLIWKGKGRAGHMMVWMKAVKNLNGKRKIHEKRRLYTKDSVKAAGSMT